MPRAGMAAVALMRPSSAAGRRSEDGRPKPPTLGKQGVNLLAEVPLFANLSRRHLRRLANLAEEANFRSGAMVVQAGQPGKAFYVVVEGRASVVRGVTGTGKRVARLGPGDFFGELALLDGGPRTASVVAETPLRTIRLARGSFRQMVKSEPQVALRMLEGVAARLRDQARLATE